MILLADSEGPDQTADAQVDLGLHCPHKPKDMFSHRVVHIIPNLTNGAKRSNQI